MTLQSCPKLGQEGWALYTRTYQSLDAPEGSTILGMIFKGGNLYRVLRAEALPLPLPAALPAAGDYVLCSQEGSLQCIMECSMGTSIVYSCTPDAHPFCIEIV